MKKNIKEKSKKEAKDIIKKEENKEMPNGIFRITINPKALLGALFIGIIGGLLFGVLGVIIGFIVGGIIGTIIK